MTTPREQRGIAGRITSMLRHARTTIASTETGAVQKVQFNHMNGAVLRDGVPSMQQYAYASGLPAGTDIFYGSESGNPAGAVAIASNHPELRPRNLPPGSAKVYDSAGTSVYLDAAGNIYIDAHKKAFVTAAEGVWITGDLHVTGTIYGDTDVIGGGKSLKTHVHTNGNGGANTGQPV